MLTLCFHEVFFGSNLFLEEIEIFYGLTLKFTLGLSLFMCWASPALNEEEQKGNYETCK